MSHVLLIGTAKDTQDLFSTMLGTTVSYTDYAGAVTSFCTKSPELTVVQLDENDLVPGARIIECLHTAHMANLAVLKAERTSGLMVAATVAGADWILANPAPEDLTNMVQNLLQRPPLACCWDT